ncbi:hypothetical protein AVEN_39133-1 [Araneus ventricosus]|uniref:Uncharacterized protein n=1 Tax=Araneus ventricosus TaxID=182803 RepID=A0A4Y2Q4K1_ARAVE|nr:hypothetical protein AVEN_39133-1 [Araneus ventricosus]
MLFSTIILNKTVTQTIGGSIWTSNLSLTSASTRVSLRMTLVCNRRQRPQDEDTMAHSLTAQLPHGGFASHGEGWWTGSKLNYAS